MPTIKQTIVPHLWYDKEAVEAAEFYTSIFDDSRVTNVTTISDTPSGTVEIVSFELLGQEFMAISAGPVFTFNESISFMVKCDTQDEIDYYWEKLTADGGQPGQCGWLKDRFGLSWQVVPADMDELMGADDPEAMARVTQAFLKMTKFDLAALRRAREGK
jgi:predicted 3-demethylubiquinone-9 3-methyltransferase (glyoxalase superfamily)